MANVASGSTVMVTPSETVVAASICKVAPDETVMSRSIGFAESQVSFPVTVIDVPSFVISAAENVPKSGTIRSKQTKDTAVRMVRWSELCVIDFAPSVRYILPTYGVTNQVETPVEDWSDEHKRNHWKSQCFVGEPRRAEEELAGKEHGDGEG